jgi:hypothetical protein
MKRKVKSLIREVEYEAVSLPSFLGYRAFVTFSHSWKEGSCLFFEDVEVNIN